MHFFPPVKAHTMALAISAIAFHKKRKYLALCITQLHHGPAVVIYNLAQFNKSWVPTVLEELTWGHASSAAKFGLAAFSADASIIFTIAKCPVVAVAFEWQTRTMVFATNLYAPVKNLCFHPWDSYELSTSGPGHMQLWRVLHKKELK